MMLSSSIVICTPKHGLYWTARSSPKKKELHGGGVKTVGNFIFFCVYVLKVLYCMWCCCTVVDVVLLIDVHGLNNGLNKKIGDWSSGKEKKQIK